MATDQSSADRQRVSDVLTQAQKYAQLDLVVEVVEARYSERRRQGRRWYIGIATTVLLALLGTSGFIIRGIQKDVKTEADKANRGTIDDFPDSQAGIGSDVNALDRDARAVLLDSAGPDEWPLQDGTFIQIGDVFYVDTWKWVDVVFPNNNRDDPEALCGIEPPGKMTVKGFNRERRSALGEYTILGDTSGTPCDTGVYFFYPVPTI